MALRIPRTIRLPFGYTIHVRQVSIAEMREAIDLEDEEPVPNGCWVVDDMTIYLQRAMPITRKRYMLCHELEHATTDLTHKQLIDEVGRP
jgi:Zn-dependent peptidase ImmA (M78 family)